jgi:hypothetical protein
MSVNKFFCSYRYLASSSLVSCFYALILSRPIDYKFNSIPKNHRVQIQFLDETLCKTNSDCGTDSYCGNEEGVNFCMTTETNPVATLSEEPPQITELVHINGTSTGAPPSASTGVEASSSTGVEPSSEPAPSSTVGQDESSANSASSEPTISPALATTVASSSTVDSTPTYSPIACRLLVLMDKSYSDRHGGRNGAIERFELTMGSISEVYEQDLGFGFDVEYIVDTDNTILNDNMTARADHANFRNILKDSTHPLLAGVGSYCSHVVITSRPLKGGANGLGGFS